MTLDENTYILGYWFACKGIYNWYMIMTRKDNKWIGQQTLRWHTGDPDPFSGADRKNIMEILPDQDKTEDELIDELNQVFEKMKLMLDDEFDSFLVQGNVEKFQQIAQTKHYLHIKMEQ